MKNLQPIPFEQLTEEGTYIVLLQEWSRSGPEEPQIFIANGKKEVDQYLIENFNEIFEEMDQPEWTLQELYDSMENSDDVVIVYPIS